MSFKILLICIVVLAVTKAKETANERQRVQDPPQVQEAKQKCSKTSFIEGKWGTGLYGLKIFPQYYKYICNLDELHVLLVNGRINPFVVDRVTLASKADQVVRECAKILGKDNTETVRVFSKCTLEGIRKLYQHKISKP